MDIFWDKTAWEDYQYWVDNDRKVLKKINTLIKESNEPRLREPANPKP